MSLNINQRKSLVSTSLFLVMFFLILLFSSLTYQVPPPPEEGVEVNLGNSSEGMGEVQPLEPSNSEPSNPSPTQTNEQEEIATQNAEEIPSPDKIADKPKQEKTVDKPQKEEKKDPELKHNPADYFNKNKNNKGGNEGKTGKEGDQGNPFGNPNAENYDGNPGNGNTPSYSLSGRVKIKLPPPSKNFQEQGTVVVTIWVDRNGKVVRVEAGARGTNTTNPNLWRLATEAAKKAEFSQKADASEIQKGTITYNFIKGQ